MKMRVKAGIVQRKLTRLLVLGAMIWVFVIAASVVLIGRNLALGSRNVQQVHDEQREKYNAGSEIGWWANVVLGCLFVFHGWVPMSSETVKQMLTCVSR